MGSNASYLLIFLFALLALDIGSQEICNNAIDDDGDNLIDLNDSDCICTGNIPTSLIPNPSFEEQVCCPDMKDQLSCAVGWIQASAATTDYVHTCGGFLNNPSISGTAPLPFPDGRGGVAFRDGVMGSSNYKEYVGGCLLEKLEPGIDYTFNFFVGFMNNIPGSSEFKIAIFASNNCTDIPFGNGSTSIGCPQNTGLFDLLGEKTVAGNNEWINVTIEFTARKEYETIVIGPGCSFNPNFNSSPYFYLDRLTLNRSSAFGGQPFEAVTGSICGDGLILQAAQDPDYSYQWYKDGVALLDETNPALLLQNTNNPEGTYLVVVSKSGSCFQSQEYELKVPPYYGRDTVSICQDEEYPFGDAFLTDAGDYERQMEAVDGCDSILQLNLIVGRPSVESLTAFICQGEEYSLLDFFSTEPGIFEINTINKAGCDSTIFLDLSIYDSPMAISVPSSIELNLGESINIELGPIDDQFVAFEWKNSIGDIIGNDPNLSMYRPIKDDVFQLEAIDINGCSLIKFVEVTVRPSYVVSMPNIFSPNEDGINDRFAFYVSPSLQGIKSLSIYDRWGNRVFFDENIPPAGFYSGWDGKVEGTALISGVYTYVMPVVFLDGIERTLSGSLTLLR